MSSLSSILLCKLSIKISCSYSASSFETHTFKVLFKFSIIVSVRRRRGEDRGHSYYIHHSQQVGAGNCRQLFSFLVLASDWVTWPFLTPHIDKVPIFSPLISGPGLIKVLCYSRPGILIVDSSKYKKKLFLISVLPNSVLEILPGTKVLTGTTTFQKSEDFFYLRAE